VDTPKGAKMREECSMEKQKARRARRSFSPEFKAEAVRLCRVGGRSVGQVAEELDLTETALREWVKRADADAGKGPPEALTTEERDELRELRKRVKRLEMEREILKKATVGSGGQRNARMAESVNESETPGG
jgi:transposase-like protein